MVHEHEHTYQHHVLFSRDEPATSRNQPAVLFSQNKPAPAISRQPTEQAGDDVNFIFYDYWYSSL
jgi:hypothetical protein